MADKQRDEKKKKGSDEAPVDLAARVGSRPAQPPPPAPAAPPRSDPQRIDGPLPPRREPERPTFIGGERAPVPDAPPPPAEAEEQKTAPIISVRAAPAFGEIDLVVTPLPTPDDWHRFELALRKVRGVSQLRPEYYRHGVAKMRVAYEGTDRLANVLRAGVPGYRVRVLGEDRATIQILVSSETDERRPGQAARGCIAAHGSCIARTVFAMADLEARAKRVLSPVLGHYTWVPVERGEGSWLITDEGRRILDLTSGIAVTPIGHAHPKVVAAVTAQVQKLSHICAGVALYEANVVLAEELVKVAPSGLDTVFFGNSGAEAIEGSIKLARQATKRQAVIVFRGGFHGRSTGAAAVTTSKAAYRRGYGALLPDVYMAPFPYPLQCPIKPAHDAEACAEHCLAELDLLLDHHVPAEHVAAILIEPVLGEGGYIAPPVSFLRALRELATRIGALLVFDEVQTGFGRTGAWFAAQKAGVTPDVMALAKALGGGLPLAAIVAPRELHAKWLTGTHGSTFGGNPVSCASGLATLEVIRDEGLVARAERLGAQMARELAPLQGDSHVREIRRYGAMVAVEFDDPKQSKAAIAAALERDVLLITCGSHDQAVRLIPPLNISEADLSIGTRALVEVVRAAKVATPA